MNSLEPKPRIAYLDIARGIGILLVVLGHCYAIPEWLGHLIFSVHMPLFFILSGYMFRGPSETGTRSWIGKNARALLLPYALTCGLVLVIQVIKALLHQEDAAAQLWHWLLTSLYGAGDPTVTYPSVVESANLPIGYIGAIWFLLALFIARVLLMLCLKSRTPFLWVMILFFASLVSKEWIGWLPFSIQAGMGALLFVYIGYVIQKKDLFAAGAVSWPVKLVMLGVWVYCIFFCGRLWMVSNTYSDGVLDIIGAVCGTFVIVWAAKGLERFRPARGLIFLGRITLGIMCAHLLVLNCVNVVHWAMLLEERLQVSYAVGELLVVFLGTAAVTAVLYWVPWIGGVLFPIRRKAPHRSGHSSS